MGAFSVVAEGEFVSVFVRGRMVLQKWASAGTGGGVNSYGQGESIRELPNRVLYVTGDFPLGWRHSVQDYVACIVHDDCRETPKLGRACLVARMQSGN